MEIHLCSVSEWLKSFFIDTGFSISTGILN